MTWRHTLALACLAAGCGHDAEGLEPDVKRDIPAWLNVPDESPCDLCMSSSCIVSASACLDDASCRMNMMQCMPPNPGCAQIDVRTRDVATCMSKDCKVQCGLLDHSVDCIGTYVWRAPTTPQTVQYELRAAVFQQVPFMGVASIATCWGPTPICDEADAIKLRIGEPAHASYPYDVTTGRPYFHVTGEGLRPMLFYEDANISVGSAINFPVVPEFLYLALADVLKVAPDPELGTLNAKIFNCIGDGLAGVELRLERDGKLLLGAELGAQYYFSERFPQPLSVQSRTSADGLGGFLNVAPGVYGLRAYLGNDPVGTIDSVIVKKGELTHVNLMPRSQDENVSAGP